MTATAIWPLMKTPAQRKAEERERKREAGLVPVQEWVHKDDAPALRRYAGRLRSKRNRK